MLFWLRTLIHPGSSSSSSKVLLYSWRLRTVVCACVKPHACALHSSFSDMCIYIYIQVGASIKSPPTKTWMPRRMVNQQGLLVSYSSPWQFWGKRMMHTPGWYSVEFWSGIHVLLSMMLIQLGVAASQCPQDHSVSDTAWQDGFGDVCYQVIAIVVCLTLR